MTTTKGNAIEEAQIRELIDDRARAVRSKDINGLMALYAPDVLSFDAVNTLQNTGTDGVRKRAAEWFGLYQGPIGYEYRDLNIAAGNDVGFSHSLNNIKGTTTDGTQVDMWVRTTVCYRKIDGRWLITHEHTSAPFNLETNSVSLDLKP